MPVDTFADTVQTHLHKPRRERPYTMQWEMGDPLYQMYGEHALRAKLEGFEQMPYGRYIRLHEELYWGVTRDT